MWHPPGSKSVAFFGSRGFFSSISSPYSFFLFVTRWMPPSSQRQPPTLRRLPNVQIYTLYILHIIHTWIYHI